MGDSTIIASSTNTTLDGCIEFDNEAYLIVVALGICGWILCVLVNLPLLITYWIMYRKRVSASDEYIEYKFSEQREVVKVPPIELSSPSTFTLTPVPSQANPMSPGIPREDPFLASPPVTYRPPTNITEQSNRWQPVKKK
ncbi:hypothetical protein CHUAL_005354 [Chamberlinius hualienensis]